ncbi:MAG TPA: hypothetical protein VHX12_14005 [Acidisoma sp.]|jgi:hypothetical protein|nr:hypothetical protein [Acidisoma sp.]
MAQDLSVSLRRMATVGALCLLSLVAVSGVARADTATAQACAAKLSPEAKAIYDRASPGVTPTTDLPGLLKGTVPGMIFEGDVSAQTARDSATAAYPCLKDLK